METLKFKTNIKCGGCIAAVTTTLDTLDGVAKWNVDTANPDKILTVESSDGLTSDEVIGALKIKGYHAEKI
ncbi:heavy-metal-associated domain-containing protein [Mucilaginibacter gilvus]|uniref:Copper chaperone n=1 Tax=Mucilaginibacter gilvus TaxID=2305909 RepID=A0A444MJI7_9SPHI|nr:heavy-metal-associated domain-containing protein [Mucilaginibacter gilvus]RWY48349.1 copper chaperone [Mucilaginibacter gilvus]